MVRTVMMILLNSLKPSPKLIHRRIQSSKFLRNNEIRKNPGDGDLVVVGLEQEPGRKDMCKMKVQAQLTVDSDEEYMLGWW